MNNKHRGNSVQAYDRYQTGLVMYRKKIPLTKIAEKLGVTTTMVNKYRKLGIASSNLASWDHVLKREVMYAQAEAHAVTKVGDTTALSRIESPEFIEIVNTENVSIMVQEALILQNLRVGVEALSSSAIKLVGVAKRLVDQAEREATCLLDELQAENDAALEEGKPLPAGTHHKRLGYILNILDRTTTFMEKTSNMNQAIQQAQRLHAGQPTEIVGHMVGEVKDAATSVDTLERMTTALKRLKDRHIIEVSPVTEEPSPQSSDEEE